MRLKAKIIRVLTMLCAVVLTAKLGTVQYGNHRETWYNLDMKNVISRTDKAMGTSDMYHVDDRGVKMYGPWVIVAADKSVPRYSFVETSLGMGVVLDNHTTGDPGLIDIATTWERTNK